MRRLLALVLLLAFGSPMVAPLLAATSDPDAGLPACCRSHGKHHCAMVHSADRIAVDFDTATFVAQACPMYPRTASLPGVASALAGISQGFSIQQRSDTSLASFHPAEAVKVFPAANPKRGPPSIAA